MAYPNPSAPPIRTFASAQVATVRINQICRLSKSSSTPSLNLTTKESIISTLDRHSSLRTLSSNGIEPCNYTTMKISKINRLSDIKLSRTTVERYKSLDPLKCANDNRGHPMRTKVSRQPTCVSLPELSTLEQSRIPQNRRTAIFRKILRPFEQ